MAFFSNIGYRFHLPPGIRPDGSIVLCSAMPMHQLDRRRIDDRYPHLRRRLFDPQLYLSGLDASESRTHCAKLATYPWFAVTGLQEYHSSHQTQSQWSTQAEARITSIWHRSPPTELAVIERAVRECVDFQLRLNCWAVILPSPLTVDPSTSYEEELLWLDAGSAYVKNVTDRPIFATIALTDFCVRYSDPGANRLLELILDSVSAREVDGAYLILEQASEPADARNCGNTRALWSMLHMIHLLSQDCGLTVGVNFLGAFGQVCRSAGADFWASGWYKSLYRFRLADKLAGGRSYPYFWSQPSALDIHLESDFDRLNRAGLLPDIADRTSASEGLLKAAAKGAYVASVPAWRYAQSNIGSAQEHFLLSMIAAEKHLSTPPDRDRIEEWLSNADTLTRQVQVVLGSGGKTRINHVSAWLEAFRRYRKDHAV